MGLRHPVGILFFATYVCKEPRQRVRFLQKRDLLKKSCERNLLQAVPAITISLFLSFFRFYFLPLPHGGFVNRVIQIYGKRPGQDFSRKETYEKEKQIFLLNWPKKRCKRDLLPCLHTWGTYNLCARVHFHTYLCVYMYIYYVCTYMYIYVYVMSCNVCIYVHTLRDMCMNIHIYICMSYYVLYACTYVYICVCI